MERDWHDLISQPRYNKKVEKDVRIRMRDGIHLVADIYRPDAEGEFPALLGLSCYGKDIQKLPVFDYPSEGLVGNGGIEAGDSEYFVSRGYVHVIADSRGTNESEGAYRAFSRQEQEDGYDLVEWIARQPWCNGNVGMLGLSYFGMIQYLVAAQKPPHLKAICPVDAATDLYRHFDYHGGILSIAFHFQWWGHILSHTDSPVDMDPEERNRIAERLMKEDDIRSFPTAYISLKFPEKNANLFNLLIHPYDGPFYWEGSAYTKFHDINIPCFIIGRWASYDTHLSGAFEAYSGLNTSDKKLMIAVPESGYGFNRPWHENHDIIVRWYDHWLKSIDTGIMAEPPISLFVQGINERRFESEWPLARTQWTKFYLREKGMLSEMPPLHSGEPDSFANKPGLKPGDAVPFVKYGTPPLEKDVEITGPMALYFYASLSGQDGDWMVVINDVDRKGLERLVSKGWLKASHREVDTGRSKPYKPFHPHRRCVPVESDNINEYAIDIRETSYVFKAGHRIELKIKGQDAPWEGKSYAKFSHLPRSRETRHTIYHGPQYLSHVLLPVVPPK
jgi:predicted acyl esterase